MKIVLDGGAAHLFVEAQTATPETIAVAGGSAAVFTARAPLQGERASEDACAVIAYGPASGVLVVSDGAGGGRQGAEAARLTVEEMAQALERGRCGGAPLRDAILDGIERASEAVRALGTGAAATVSAVEIDEENVRPYHVGDSMILVVGGRGRVKHQSLPHGPVGYAVEAGLLSETEAMHHDQRHLISNAVGAADMRIEVGPRIRLAARDTLLLASDGLFDNLYVEEIVAGVRRGALTGAAAALAARCRQRMTAAAAGEPSKADDLTLVLFRPGTAGVGPGAR